MSNDRGVTLRHAEDLARQGKLGDAIAECTRLLEWQPHDWNTANLLGDLLVRAGNISGGIEQFTRSASVLATDGFAARACAIYKKILKLQPDSDHALMQSGELSARQGLVTAAREFFRAASTGRRTRGDRRGALDVIVRIAALDREDVQARLEGARARITLEDTPGGLQDLTQLGLELVEQGRMADALTPFRDVVSLDPGNTMVAEMVALLSNGRLPEAAALANGIAEAALAAGTAEAQALPADAPAADDVAISAVVVVDAAHEAPGSSHDTRDIESIFAQLRDEVRRISPEDAAYVAFTRGSALADAGDFAGGAEQLSMAARSPKFLYAAATRLADVCERQRRFDVAIEWLGQALNVPDLLQSQRCETLLRLAQLLEQQGEPALALAACLELQVHVTDYKDVRARVARLERLQTGG